MIYTPFDDTEMVSGALILPGEDTWRAVGYRDEQMAKSIFSRLYLMNGAGLTYFEPAFAHDSGKIRAYKIRWPRVTRGENNNEKVQ